MRSPIVVLLVALAGCIHSNAVTCDDGNVCPEGTVCTTTTVEGMLCATPGQLAECAGQPDETPCGTGDSRCYDHVCLPGGCGNRHVDPGEVCDDGNHVAGDGCAADCLSNETCGNGHIEAVFGELCDDGNPISSDGCSSACQLETPNWVQETLLFAKATANAAVAYDTARDRLVQFDGTNGGTLVAGTWEWDGNGYVMITPTISPRLREGARMVYDAHRRRIVLFGGGDTMTPLGPFADTWSYDGLSWTSISTAHTPPARMNHAMIYDSERDVVVVFGGSANTAGGQPLGDLWTFDGTDWHEDTATGPAARFDAGFAYDPSRGVAVLAGGATAAGVPVADVWTLDAAGWHAASALPQARSQLALAFDPASRRVLAIAGAGSGGALITTTEAFDGTTWTAVAATIGGRRSFGAVTLADGRIATVGGYPTTGTSGSTQIQVIANDAAVAVTPQTPTARTEAAAAHTRGKALLFGGSPGAGADFADTWEIVGAGMNKLAPATSPSARHGHAMAYDPDHDRVVLFGGSDKTPTLLGDTWLWDGTTWTQVTPPNAPSPRKWHAMAYDAARHEVVLYGGLTNLASQTPADDTWTWDGTTWTPRATGMPPARAMAAMADDPLRERIALFGGRDASQPGPYGDTWEWDGTAWAQRVPDEFPSPRQGATMAWNPSRERLTLTSGLNINDTWEWNGQGWREVVTNSMPTAHELSSAYSVAGGVAFYGGDTTSGPFSVEFALRWAAPRAPENCRSTGLDVDGDGTIGCADPDCWFLCDPDCPPGASCDASRPRCGDGSCSELETCRSCPADCGTCAPVCGDFICDGEATTCPGDCTP